LGVEVSCRDARIAVDEKLVRELVRLVETGERQSLPVSVSIVDDAEIHRINRQFLGHDEPTDVIAFDLGDEVEGSVAGEVVVSAQCAERVAAELGHGARDELFFYICHGLLHLCGWDDADAKSRESMHERQRAYLARLGMKVGV
jgi:probable rRNA maturation factor